MLPDKRNFTVSASNEGRFEGRVTSPGFACLILGLTDLSFLRRDANIAKRDWPVVTLEHQRSNRHLAAECATGGTLGHLDVVVNNLAVQFHLDELRVAGLLLAVESWRLEVDDVFLPFAWHLARVELWHRDAVDGAHVAHAERFAAEAIEDLDFVAAHQIDAGVGVLGNHHLDLDKAIAEFLFGV